MWFVYMSSIRATKAMKVTKNIEKRMIETTFLNHHFPGLVVVAFVLASVLEGNDGF